MAKKEIYYRLECQMGLETVNIILTEEQYYDSFLEMVEDIRLLKENQTEEEKDHWVTCPFKATQWYINTPPEKFSRFPDV